MIGHIKTTAIKVSYTSTDCWWRDFHLRMYMSRKVSKTAQYTNSKTPYILCPISMLIANECTSDNRYDVPATTKLYTMTIIIRWDCRNFYIICTSHAWWSAVLELKFAMQVKTNNANVHAQTDHSRIATPIPSDAHEPPVASLWVVSCKNSIFGNCCFSQNHTAQWP